MRVAGLTMPDDLAPFSAEECSAMAKQAPPEPIGYMRPAYGGARDVEDVFTFMKVKGLDVELVRSSKGWWVRERETDAMLIADADGAVWRVK
jgi:hypothetical protein